MKIQLLFRPPENQTEDHWLKLWSSYHSRELDALIVELYVFRLLPYILVGGLISYFTLALMLLPECSDDAPQITGIHTEGGICQIQCDNKRPRLMEITNLCDQSITDVIVTDDHNTEEWLDKGIRQKL